MAGAANRTFPKFGLNFDRISTGFFILNLKPDKKYEIVSILLKTFPDLQILYIIRSCVVVGVS